MARWVLVLGVCAGFWCANVYCHQGDGAVKILCGPQSNDLVRERFSCVRGVESLLHFWGIEPLAFPSFAAIPNTQTNGTEGAPGGISPKSMARPVLVLGV